MNRTKARILLFDNSNGQELKREYPELFEIEEFKDLDVNKARFCWLVGNTTSPIFKLERWARIRKALRIVWGATYKQNPVIKDLVEARKESDLPQDILKAIERMNKFNPTYRLKAKLMAEYIFESLNELIVLDDITKASMDVDDKKKHAELMIKVSSQLNDMVDRIENAYGVKVIEESTGEEIMVDINDLMNI